MSQVASRIAGEAGGQPAVQELWAELSRSMRLLRQQAAMSLRQAELASGWGRGTLSQFENGRSRPNREVVEWYERTFGGDGLLVSLYAEARGARGTRSTQQVVPQPVPGDAIAVESPLLPEGELVPCGADVVAGWTFVNSGEVPWRDRHLERVGTHTAARLIGSAPAAPIPDCDPGERVRVELAVTVPDTPGTFAAHWIVVDRDGRPTFDSRQRVRVVLTARE